MSSPKKTENYNGFKESAEHPFKKEDMEPFGVTFRIFIRNRLFQKGGNRDLIKSCIAVSGNDDLNESKAAFVIIEKLWERLKETHGLKIVK